MDHEQDPEQHTWVDWQLPDLIIGWIGLIVVICVGFWQVFVTVADHQRGQLGDGRGYDGPAERSTPDATGCRLRRQSG